MIVFQGDNDIGMSLWRLVQAWIVAERIGQRLAVRWDHLPPDKLHIAPFYDANRLNTTGAMLYVQGAYREETNPHLLLYYYRRIFIQILIQRHRQEPHTLTRIAFWGDDALTHFDTINNHYRYTFKEFYKFTGTNAIESWTAFFYLRDCDVIIASSSRFIDAAIKTSGKKRERWLVNGIGITLEK